MHAPAEFTVCTRDDDAFFALEDVVEHDTAESPPRRVFSGRVATDDLSSLARARVGKFLRVRVRFEGEVDGRELVLPRELLTTMHAEDALAFPLGERHCVILRLFVACSRVRSRLPAGVSVGDIVLLSVSVTTAKTPPPPPPAALTRELVAQLLASAARGERAVVSEEVAQQLLRESGAE